MKKKPEEEDTLDASVLSAVSKLDYVGDAERASYSESISARIRSEPYLASLCRHQADYLHCAAAALASFGTEDRSAVVLGSRTQVSGRHAINTHVWGDFHNAIVATVVGTMVTK